MDQKKRPLHVGLLFDESNPNERILIYGIDEIVLESVAEWSIDTMGVQAPVIALWQGDSVRGFSFNYTLTAGVEGKEIFPSTREDLVKYMRWIHSWNTHDITDNGLVQSPPALRLVLGDYINMRGILKDVRTSAKSPWGGITSGDVSNSNINALAPTSCTFSGTFCFLPGYDQSTGVIDLTINKQRLSAKSIKEKFFKS